MFEYDLLRLHAASNVFGRVSTRTVPIIQMATTVRQVTRVIGTKSNVTYRSSMVTRCANATRNSGELLSNLLQCCCKQNAYKWSMKNRGFLSIYDRMISDLLNVVEILISILFKQL